VSFVVSDFGAVVGFGAPVLAGCGACVVRGLEVGICPPAVPEPSSIPIASEQQTSTAGCRMAAMYTNGARRAKMLARWPLHGVRCAGLTPFEPVP
jgi:hypothetical protein